MRRALPLAAVAVAVLAAAASAAAAGLPGLLLRSGEQPGFRVRSHPLASRSLAVFLKGIPSAQRKTFAKELRAGGFKAFATEQLAGARHAQGFSLVVWMGSRAAAKEVAAVLAKQAAIGQEGKLTPLTVKGVPSSLGLVAVGAQASTTNVYWTAGSCTFGAGDYRPGRDRTIASPVVSGVRSLVKRTRRAC